MNILAVDDNKLALKGLERTLRGVMPDEMICSCTSSEEALRQAVNTEFDVAFLDIEMRQMNGVELAKKLMNQKNNINIVFVTAYDEYQREAFDMHVSGYVMKPVTEDKIHSEIDHLRYPVSRSKQEKKHEVKIQAFGNFEIFVDNKPLKFSYQKSKEILAFLVDRNGAFVTNNEIIDTLSESGTEIKGSYFRNLRVNLLETLEKAGCQDIIIRGHGSMAIAKEKVSCDYYDYLDKQMPDLFKGEYMQQYSWGEITNGWLTDKMIILTLHESCSKG